MEKRYINPWSWAEKYGISHAVEVTKFESLLVVGGQASVDDQGETVSVGDMRGQIAQAMDNLEAVLAGAGYEGKDLIRLDYNVTVGDIDTFVENVEVAASRLEGWNVTPPGVLVGVARLGFPEWMVEIEAMAAK